MWIALVLMAALTIPPSTPVDVLKCESSTQNSTHFEKLQAATSEELTLLGIAHAEARDWVFAERCFQFSLKLSQQSEEPEGVRVAADLSNLVGVYIAQRRYATAEPLIIRILKIFERHPEISRTDLWFQTLDDYCCLLSKTGRKREAKRVAATAR